MSNRPNEVDAALVELEKHYKDFEENNRGANGYLFFSRNKVSHQQVAIKFYYGEQGERQHDEPRQLATVNSPNVLQILDARMISDDWGYFITPRCTEGDLDDFIQSHPSALRAIDAAIAICRGVSAIHAQNMVHRDLKPGNIVLDGGTPKIADFGSVRLIEEGRTTTHASRHSILYRPPESFDVDEYGKYGDVYQIGLITYQMLGGALSYNGEDYLTRKDRAEYEGIDDYVDRSIFVDGAIARRAREGKLVDFKTLPPWVSGATKRCLNELLAPDPGKRIDTVSTAAARLTQARATLRDWCWDGDVAKLHEGGTSIEVRPTTDGRYEAFQLKNGNARRVRGLGKESIREIVQHLS